MKVLTINIPDHLDINEQEAKTRLAADFYESGKLSLEQAADLAGYTLRTFMEILSKYNVSVFNFDKNELEQDIANAGNYHI